MERSGNDLIVQFNRGDTAAFSAIYNEYYPGIYYFVRRFINKREDAEDITADIFVKLWKMHTDITSINNAQAFLYISARNTCIDFLRQLKRQNERQKELLHILMQEHAEDILKEDLKAEVLQSIFEEIENLPPACKRVFKMSYLDNLSNDTIADMLQINNQSVRNHKQRAIKLLRIALLNKKIAAAALIIYLFYPFIKKFLFFY
jgi:RNA polymerase sigma-70 factor (family 1)